MLRQRRIEHVAVRLDFEPDFCEAKMGSVERASVGQRPSFTFHQEALMTFDTTPSTSSLFTLYLQLCTRSAPRCSLRHSHTRQQLWLRGLEHICGGGQGGTSRNDIID